MDKNELKRYGIPKSVRVGSFDYRVLFPYDFNEDNRLIAQHDLYNFTLKVGIKSPSHQSEILPRMKVHECLLHEIMHAIDHIYCGSILTEDDVDLFAMVWHFILQHNKLGLYKRSEKIPSRLRLFNMEYEVKYKKFADLNDEDVFLYSCNTNTIWLDDRFKDRERYSFNYLWFGLSEIISSLVVSVFSLNQFMKPNGTPPKEAQADAQYPEKALVSFSHGILQVLRENNIEGMIDKYE